ncbi:hypothetical protein SSP24_41860 [Streptomyces spinoverrucosus]|uniref:Uncharacterized protein n=1 Tax=Streptomyces spinoverrucosus TaxID=284043 RepID=A0A4Y3VLD0_9ACTN|nr:hypothetical protein [Streptomyces spinoverrucosus]GEC06531.1 hypothetical protein SSP24_41860 [Streptomyces spinoverrucosus]GHB54528.1 hypothetical protein GCM10010397_25990 [Streptomyces spinoverrucosus]
MTKQLATFTLGGDLTVHPVFHARCPVLQGRGECVLPQRRAGIDESLPGRFVVSTREPEGDLKQWVVTAG